ncbi:MAG: hypothetical protein PHP08_01160 [Candidatus Dojkabacteria bacterium]|nr:hypothetical protein [Candidatus Dojkabacteria bacterium]
MKRFLKRLGYIFLIPLVVITILLLPVHQSFGAPLSYTYVTLSRIKGGLTSTANLEIYIAFTPSANLLGTDTITLDMEFPDGDDGLWCRVAGSDLTVSGVPSTPADSTGNYVVGSSLPAQTALTASCSQGSGAGSVDTITIGDIDDLTAGVTYGVKISNGSTAKLGTATSGQKVVTLSLDSNDAGGDPAQSKSFALSLVDDDQVVVSAEVVAVGTVTCTILGGNTVDLGSLYQGASYTTGTHDIRTSTSGSAAGYYWAVYGYGNGSSGDAGLYNSSGATDILESTGSGTIDLTGPGSEGFGMTASDPDGGDPAVVELDFRDTTPGVFGALDRTADNAQIFLYQIGAQTTSEDSTITYGARAGTSALAGNYEETVTFICGGYY